MSFRDWNFVDKNWASSHDLNKGPKTPQNQAYNSAKVVDRKSTKIGFKNHK